ncbi:MAG TPA: condensation domain-containing protein, partial [Solirubrobacteraceae bacterium]
VVLAGEALQPASLRPWFDFFGEDGPALVNMYGITETTVHSTYRVMRASDCPHDASPIGAPIPDLGLYLLDRSGAPVPPGVTGEIYVGGAGVTRGYLNRPELTAERFLKNPFGPGRLYRSGDLARRTPDGETMFLGRMDDQIKVRGFRIELGEIRSVLEDHEAVADSAVLAHRSADGDTRLAAYFVPSEERRSASELRSDLRAHLESRLPGYMVPSSITLLDELPLTTNGKLDRRALPAPDWEREREVSFASPRTPGEMQVARHWQEVLEVGKVGRGDNFFRMGGHSLLAARLVARVRESLGVELSVRTLFEHPTLSAFAEQVDAATAGASERSLQHTAPERSGALEHPVSFQQEQMLFFDNFSPGKVTYNGALVVRVGGELDCDELREALTEVQRRHEVLRTVLSSDEHSVRQIVREQLDYELALEDLTDTPAAVSESELEAILRKHALVPFDLAREAPLRTQVFRLGPSEHVIMFALHHIAFDARAVEVLFGEISEIYAARRAGRTPVLPELTLQYGDFARWQRERLGGRMLEDELDFWRSSLAGAPTAIQLPTDHRRPATQTFDGASLVARYDGRLAGRIDAVCQTQGVTPYMLLLAAFATLLYRRSGQDDILISGPMENRSAPGLDHLIGFFANTSVVRVRLGGNPTLSALLGGVRDSVLASYEHQEVPLELIVDAVRPARLPGVNPLVQVNFRVRSGALPSLSLAGAQTTPAPVDLGIARFDLALELHLIEDGLAAEWIWNTALFVRERVERLASDFESLLIQALADPGKPVLALELPDERSPQLQSDGATPTPSIRRVRAVGRGSR